MFTRMNRELKIKRAFERIKEEMDDHLTAINENTKEIQNVYDYIAKIEEKIEKLNEKIEGVQLLLSQLENIKNPKKINDLTLKQQEVFLILYTNKEFLSYEELSERTGFKVGKLKEIIKSLIKKGIPIIKKQQKDLELVKLDKTFRTLQTKSQIVEISEEVGKEVSKESILEKKKRENNASKMDDIGKVKLDIDLDEIEPYKSLKEDFDDYDDFTDFDDSDDLDDHI